MLGFILAIVAGFLTPFAEAPLAQPLAKAVSRFITLEPVETRLIAFMLMALAAAILSLVFSSGNVLWIVIGLLAGYFGTRILAALREAFDKRGA